MNSKRLLFAVTGVALLATVSFAQDLDKAFYGRWNMNLSKSKITSRPDLPKISYMIIGLEGWISMQYTDKGILAGYAVAFKADGGCTLIGFAAGLSCFMKISDPQHASWTVKQGDRIVQTFDVELTEGSLHAKGQRRQSNGQMADDDVFYEKAASTAR